MNEGKIRHRINATALDAMPVTVEVTLPVRLWVEFEQHCVKAGSSVAREISDQAKEAIERIAKAKAILKGEGA